MGIFNKKQIGFTIIELSVIIVVIGILAAVTIAGVGAWRNRVAVTEVKSDLMNAVAAMESARNFSNGYPLATPSSFTASPGVTLTYISGDANNFCIEAASNAVPTIVYFVKTSDVIKQPQLGTCAGGAGPIANGFNRVVSGYNHTCGISTLGKAYCWGYNTYGQLGNNSTTDSSVPVAVNTSGVLSGKIISSISAGNSHTCALTTEGRAYCWGYNYAGVFGDNSTTDSLVPVAVNTSGVLSGKTISTISAKTYSTCALTTEGRAYCWGRNAYGQLGNNSTTDSSVPVAVNTSGVLSGKSVASITLGNSHACAHTTDGIASCWGRNQSGQLGNNSTTDSLVPVAVNTSGVLSGKTISSISAGGTVSDSFTCAHTTDGIASCWGDNYNAQLGNNSTTDSLVPVAVNTSGVLSGKTISSISTGDLHACVLTTENKAYCWGNNYAGGLGNNSTTTSLVPVAVNTSGVLSGKNVSSISSGRSKTCVITTENKAYCWGDNAYGMLGNNSTTTSLVPVAVIDTP